MTPFCVSSVPFIEKYYSDIMHELVRGAVLQCCLWMPTGGLAVLLRKSQGQVLEKLVNWHMNLWGEVGREEHGDDHYEIVCEDLEKE